MAPRVPVLVTTRTHAVAGDKAGKRHDHASCDRPPSSPSGLVGVYDTHEGERYGRFTLRTRWDSVEVDSIGNPIRIRRYNEEWQTSDDDGGTWRDSGRARVPAKDDDDDPSKPHYVITKIQGRLRYRFRVQAIAQGGCEGTWSAYTDVGAAIQTPPEVENLTLDIDEHSARGHWDIPKDTDNTDVRDQRITHVEVELFKGAVDTSGPVGKVFRVASQAAMTGLSSAEKYDVAWRTDQRKGYQLTATNPAVVGNWDEINLVAVDKFRMAEHWHTKLLSPPGNTTFHLRVRTISAEGARSDWVETTATKDTPSQPAAPTITFDALGTRHARFRAEVTVAEVFDTDFEIKGYRVQWVDKRTAGTPDDHDERRHAFVKAKGTNKELTHVFGHVPADNFTYARTQAVDKDDKESAWSSWQAGGKPSASDNVPALTDIEYITAKRRIGVKWKAPMVGGHPDERIGRVRIQIATDNGFVTIVDEAHKHPGHGSYRYAMPEDQIGTTFYLRIRSEDDADNVGPWQPSATGQPLVAEADEGSGLPAAPGTPAAPSCTFDVNGTRHARYRVVVTPGVSSSGGAADIYRLAMAHSATDGGSSPPSGTRRRYAGVDADATGDDRTHSFVNIPKRHYVWVRERARNAGGASSWTSWVALGRGVDSGASSTPATPSSVSNDLTTPKRLTGSVPDPDDDEVTKVRWRTFREGTASAVEDITTRNTEHTYRIPRANIGSKHEMRARYVNDLGIEGGERAPGLGTPTNELVNPDDIDVTTLSEIADNLGTIVAGSVYAAYISTKSFAVADANYITLDGTSSSKDRIQFVSTGGATNLRATNGGVQLGASAGSSGAKLGFYGKTPIVQPTAPGSLGTSNPDSGPDNNARAAINAIRTLLINLGLAG